MDSIVADEHVECENVYSLLGYKEPRTTFYFFYGTVAQFKTYQWPSTESTPICINENTLNIGNQFCIMELLKYMIGIAKKEVLVVIYCEKALPVKYYDSSFIVLPTTLLRRKR